MTGSVEPAVTHQVERVHRDGVATAAHSPRPLVHGLGSRGTTRKKNVGKGGQNVISTEFLTLPNESVSGRTSEHWPETRQIYVYVDTLDRLFLP